LTAATGVDPATVVVIDPEKDSPHAQPAGSPGEAVMDFHDGLQSGDLKHAMPFVAAELELDEQARKTNHERLRRFSEQMAHDVYDFRVVSFRVDNDCAIVIVQDTIASGARLDSQTTPVRHFYLIRHSGLWKVLPRLASTAGARLTREQQLSFIRLVEWFEEMKDQQP